MSLDIKKNCLLIFIGQCFRDGSQLSILNDTENSIITQIEACKSHNNFIDHLEKNNWNVDVLINTYNSKNIKLLCSQYSSNLIKFNVFEKLIGYENLVNTSLKLIDYQIDKYDFIYYIRIDVYLTPLFIELFNPNPNVILFPFLMWELYEKKNNIPPITDVMMYIPKKYFYITKKIYLYHSMLYNYKTEYNLTNDDIDLILITIHDSDSEKDYNPLYYMVSRKRINTWYQQNYVCDKNNFFTNNNYIINIMDTNLKNEFFYNKIFNQYLEDIEVINEKN